MLRTSFGVLIITLATLVPGLMLTRAFDVALSPGMAYFVATSAIFGLPGIYATVRPLTSAKQNKQLKYILLNIAVKTCTYYLYKHRRIKYASPSE